MASITTTFLDLPPEVRLGVYRYLLLTRSNKFIDPTYNMAHYDLQPAILQTCGLIKKEACAVLYGENTFVQIVHDSPLFERELRKHDVPLLCKSHPRQIPRMCGLEVTIDTGADDPSAKYRIMIGSEELELMCTLLWITLLGRRHVDVYLNFSQYVNAITLPPNRQDQLLLPFKTLFRASSITVQGATNQNLAAEVEYAPLKFISMSAVELLELMRLLRREGEQYQNAGNYRRSIMCLMQALDININHEKIRVLRKPDSGGPWPGQSLWAALAIEYFRNSTALSIMLKEVQSWHGAYKEIFYALKMGSNLKKSWVDCPISDEEIENLKRQKAELGARLV